MGRNSLNDDRALSSSTPRFDASLFQPEVLTSDYGLEKAVAHIFDIVARREPEKALHVIVQGLCGNAFLFEYIYGVDEGVSTYIRAALLEHFPKITKEFLRDQSPCSYLITRLKNVSIVSPEIETSNHQSTLLPHPHSIENDLKALDILNQLDLEALDLTFNPEEPIADSGIRFKKSQRAVKDARRINTRLQAAEKLLAQLDPIPNCQTPSNSEEACALQGLLLERQADTLLSLLDYLALPHVHQKYAERFFSILSLPNENLTLIKTVSPVEASTENEASAAVDSDEFEVVRPIRSGLLFQNAAELGPWKVLVSGEALQHLRQHIKSGSFAMIRKKIKELSDGFFSDSNMKPLTSSKDLDVIIYEAKMSKNLRLVYQVDVIPDADPEIETQGLVLWGVYNHNELKRGTWELVAKKLQGRGKQYTDRCKFRWKPDKCNYYQPTSFPQPSPVLTVTNDHSELSREESLELHNLLNLQKLFPLSEHLLNSILYGTTKPNIFGPSADEIRIIQYGFSCYVIGRSGTGKTTAILFKMLAVEVNYMDRPDLFPCRPKQLFVTQSRVLALRVKEYYEKLALMFNQHSELDGSGLEHEITSEDTHGDGGLYPDVTGDGLPPQLPRSFSMLNEAHYPLFLSFDQLCKLLENDFNLAFGGQNTSSATPISGVTLDPLISNPEDAAQSNFSNLGVTYDVFLDAYWPHFSDTLKKRLDSFLVFSEIIGVIKGSEDALKSKLGFLTENEYLNISSRKSTFAEQRQRVYDIFKAYQKMKSHNRDYDAADRSQTLLRHARGWISKNMKVDFLYVDEVQDNTMVDVRLLRLLCRNRHGMCWAGDTAQTIAAGSSFRFSDLKASLHRLEEALVSRASKGCQVIEPPVFQLTRNYRSHGGIIDCASSVVELITTFWPDSIDRLEKEQGIVSGSNLRPIFFRRSSDSEPQYMHFTSSGERLEFGAQQCILVRDTACKNRLREAVGDIGIILTIYECKGLEFGDVLLYDFFSDSSFRLSDWRVILNAINEQDREGVAVPAFVETRHRGIGTELKNLYVALTRARSQVWIMDSSDRGEPMRTFWTSHQRIVNWESGQELPPMAVSSTPEEWKERGETLYSNNRYQEALFCFTRANAPSLMAICRAYILLKEAEESRRHTKEAQRNTSKSKFLAAAEAFSVLEMPRKWARLAAECFHKGGDDIRAANSYLVARAFSEAANHFWLGQAYDEMWAVVLEHSDSLPPDDREKFVNRLRLHYTGSDQFCKSSLLFDTDEEQLEFMEERGLDHLKARFLVFIDRRVDAADVFLSEGEPLEAIDVLWGTSQPVYEEKAKNILLDELWRSFPMQFNHSLGFDAQPLLNWISKTNPTETFDETSIFSYLICERFDGLTSKALAYMSSNMLPAAMNLLDAAFGEPFPLQEEYTLEYIGDRLSLYNRYVNFFQKMSASRDAIYDLACQRLLGFKRFEGSEEGNLFIFSLVSPLRSLAERYSLPLFRKLETGYVVVERNLVYLCRRFLDERLRIIIIEEERKMRSMRSMALCLSYALTGNCARRNCPDGHYGPSQLTDDLYRLRLSCHFQQMQLMAHVARDLRKRLERIWFARLFDALKPSLGSAGNPSMIPRSQLAVLPVAVHDWIQDAIFGLHPVIPTEPHSMFLLDLTRLCAIAFVLHYNRASKYVFQCPSCTTIDKPPGLLRDQDNKKYYVVHDLFVFLASKELSCLHQGNLFLSHVIQSDIKMDISVLLCLVEEACAKHIVQEKVQHRRSLHGLMIPKSWLLQYYGKVPSEAFHGHLMSLIRCICLLMHQLHTGNNIERFILQMTSSLRFPHIRAIFTLRLCRCLSLLAYNTGGIHSTNVKNEVLRAMHTMQTPHIHYRRFAYARDWPQVASIIRTTFGDQELDEMILLSHQGKGSLRNQPGLRLISYRDENHLLAMIQQGLPLQSKITTVVKESISGWIPSQSNEEQAVGQVEGLIPLDLQEAADDKFGFIEEEPLDHIFLKDPSVRATEMEIQAAIKIQTIMRQYLERRNTLDNRRLRLNANVKFLQCYFFYKKESTWNTRGPDFRRVCLWRVPHLLSALNPLKDSLLEAKVKWKKRFSEGKHGEVDEVNRRLTDIATLLKRQGKLSTILDLRSQNYISANTGDIEQRALQFLELVNDASSVISSQGADRVRETLKKGMQPLGSYFRRPTAKPQKPKLNTEDLDSYDAEFDM